MVHTKKRGFTLIELLIVISVIAVLVTIAILALPRIQKQARDTKRKGDMHALSVALQGYNTDKQSFPDDGNDNGLAILAPAYISKIPKAPNGAQEPNADYTYVSHVGNNYTLCVHLEISRIKDSPDTMWVITPNNTGGEEVLNDTCGSN